MGIALSQFMMELQEGLLTRALPKAGDLHPQARSATVKNLARAVSDLVAALKPDLVLEIGAHAAEFSRDMKAKLPDARVIAFEANPTVHAKFEDELAGTGVDYRFQCVADENRPYEFAIPGDDRPRSTMGSILSYRPSGIRETYEVQGRRLDDLLNGSSETSAMWIDVEGAIGAVLAGAPQSLARCSLLFAELEATPRWEGQLLDTDVIRILAGYGLVPVLRDIQRSRWQHNVLFLREELLADPEVLRICTLYLTQSLRPSILGERPSPEGAEQPYLEGRVQKLQRKVDDLRKERRDLLARLARATAARDEALGRLDAVLGSTAWQLTRPLRVGVSTLRRWGGFRRR